MAARDLFHQAVKHALEKEAWHITHDPLTFEFLDKTFHIDLGAERVIGAEKAGQKIAVEIKSFLGSSAVTDFHAALGQFMNYLLILEHNEPDRILYLAVPKDTYQDFFLSKFGLYVVGHYQLKLIVYSAKEEVILKWIN